MTEENSVGPPQWPCPAAIEHRRGRDTARHHTAADRDAGHTHDVAWPDHDLRRPRLARGSRRRADEHTCYDPDCRSPDEGAERRSADPPPPFAPPALRYRIRMADDPAHRRVVLVDADGRPTHDRSAVVAGEVTEVSDDGKLIRRTRVFLTREQLPSWVPVDEPALLLWVLAGLVLIWAAVAVVLAAT